MQKTDLDAILKELGVSPGEAANTPRALAGARTPRKPIQPDDDAAQATDKPDAPKTGTPAETAKKPPLSPLNLNRLGVDDSGVGLASPSFESDAAPMSPAGSDADTKRKHTIDQAEQAFAPLPAVPSGQRSARKNIIVSDDPAVPVAPADSGAASVGHSINQIYSGEDAKPQGETAQAGAAGQAANLSAAAGNVFGQLVLTRDAATPQMVAAAIALVKQTPGKRLADALLERGADPIKLQRCVAEHNGVPFENIDLAKGLDGGFDGKLLQRLSVDFCKEHQCVPLRIDGSRPVVGFVRPENVFLADEIARKLGVHSIKPVVVTAYDVAGALDIVGAATGTQESKIDVNELLEGVDSEDVKVQQASSAEVDLEKEAGEGPVIRYVNYIILKAAQEGASDIHIEPGEKRLKVRFRVDGELAEAMEVPISMAAAITSRLKIMANLDIAERRMPQDGRIRCSVQGRKLDLRVSTLPLAAGEKTVMRILDTRSINVKLEDLGFDEDALVIWKGLIDAPHGIVLVTGPTGSGKTTTLYASLKQLDKSTMNVSTVEDPVEYHLDGISQCQTHDKIGMTFAKALKALLRQDPDVIMLGEIRDHETAMTAIQAALTGHLVLSTLHTNDAPSSITRLVNIGLEPFLVGAAVNGVLAQRLLRRLCKECKHETTPTEQMSEFLTMQGMNAEKMWSPKGCERCHNRGYSGRVGIYELLVVDDSLRDIIARNPNVSELRRLCAERGMVTLRADGLKKAGKGMTSVEEVLRVTEATI